MGFTTNLGREERRLQLVFYCSTRDKIEGLGLGEQRERRWSYHAFLMAPRASLSALVLKRIPHINVKNRGLLTRVFFSTKQAKDEKIMMF